MKITTYRKLIVLLFVILIIVIFFSTKHAINVYDRHSKNKCNQQPQAPAVCPYVTVQASTETQNMSAIDTRDRKVEVDTLYPPLGRTENKNFAQQLPMQRTASNGIEDSFRLIGYLTSEEMKQDVGANNWRLYGRMKDRHEGEYYIMPTDKTIDMKIPLTRDVVQNQRLRDLYSLPTEIQLNSPLLNTGKYRITELPRSDFNSGLYF